MSSPETWVPSSPINSKGDRVLVRGNPRGVELLRQQMKATGSAQKRERVRTYLEKVDGLVELVTDEQLNHLVHIICHVAHENARNYVKTMIGDHLMKVMEHVPTDYDFPDPREQPLILEIPGAPAPPDPLVAESQQGRSPSQ